MRRFLLILAVVLFAMTAFAAIAPGLYRVNVNSTLNVRNAPGGAKIGSLSNGDLVQVTACEDDWAQVSLNDGRTGYVHEQYLEPFSTLAAPAGTSYSTVGLSELRHYTPFANSYKKIDNSKYPSYIRRVAEPDECAVTPSSEHEQFSPAP